ncbi:Fic family protein [Variovorax brevis]|uniref:Fic family protein n=1 Tax=Variovorax brevis TaxID=3053503 RepID=UPI003365AF31
MAHAIRSATARGAARSHGRLHADGQRQGQPPLMKAALASFGFVFLQPFVDGNGRLSRLLAHQSLNYTGALPGDPALVSRYEEGRKGLPAGPGSLQQACALTLGRHTYIDGSQFDFQFRSSSSTRIGRARPRPSSSRHARSPPWSRRCSRRPRLCRPVTKPSRRSIPLPNKVEAVTKWTGKLHGWAA